MVAFDGDERWELHVNDMLDMFDDALEVDELLFDLIFIISELFELEQLNGLAERPHLDLTPAAIVNDLV